MRAAACSILDVDVIDELDAASLVSAARAGVAQIDQFASPVVHRDVSLRIERATRRRACACVDRLDTREELKGRECALCGAPIFARRCR